jgi:hypothetical protein
MKGKGLIVKSLLGLSTFHWKNSWWALRGTAFSEERGLVVCVWFEFFRIFQGLEGGKCKPTHPHQSSLDGTGFSSTEAKNLPK